MSMLCLLSLMMTYLFIIKLSQPDDKVCSLNSQFSEIPESSRARYIYIFLLQIDFREMKRERGRNIDLLLHLLLHLLVDSCMCSDQGLNPQPWIGTALEPAELPARVWADNLDKLCHKLGCWIFAIISVARFPNFSLFLVILFGSLVTGLFLDGFHSLHHP